MNSSSREASFDTELRYLGTVNDNTTHRAATNKDNDKNTNDSHRKMGSITPEPSAIFESTAPAPANNPQPILHVVHFRFFAHIPPSTRADIAQQFLALQSRCLSPRTRKPYIRSFTGGRDVSVEDLHKGFHAVFVLEFASQDDRDWYVREDPVHRGFGVEVLTGVVEEVMVVDFRRGEF